MRNKILVIALILLTFTACNEEHFANKVMKDIGNGVYASPLCEGRSIYPLDLLNHSEVFDLANIHNEEAKTRSKIKNFEVDFQTNIMFDKFILIESIHSNVDLLSLNVRYDSNEVGSSQEDIDENFNYLRENAKLNDKNYFSLGEKYFISTAYTNIDRYFMKYKVSTRQVDKIAYMTVMKIPNKGYRVTSFVIM